jgi:hypothetical protein
MARGAGPVGRPFRVPALHPAFKLTERWESGEGAPSIIMLVQSPLSPCQPGQGGGAPSRYRWMGGGGPARAARRGGAPARGVARARGRPARLAAASRCWATYHKTSPMRWKSAMIPVRLDLRPSEPATQTTAAPPTAEAGHWAAPRAAVEALSLRFLLGNSGWAPWKPNSEPSGGLR